jgi:hypothetical protein
MFGLICVLVAIISLALLGGAIANKENNNG